LEIDALMKILGFNITRTPTQAVSMPAGSAASEQKNVPAPAVPVFENRGGWFRIFESFKGAWQKGVTVDYQSILTYHAIFACITLIASDIAKLMVRLVQIDADGIWSEVTNAAFSPVLAKPNHYQNRIQFWETWILSKLIRGNTYVLKERDKRNVVVALYVLNPDRVRTLVAADGGVYYSLRTDYLANVGEIVTVPASEIIHDRWNCLYHPLVGISPLVACGIAAMQGMAIQTNQTNFFNNKSMPGGMLIAPGAISNETAERLKTNCQDNFTGENAGNIAVLGDGLKYEPIAFTSAEMQMIDQLKWTAEVACSVFHVPPYKVGVGDTPVRTTVESLNLEYYAQALQRPIEDAELCMDEGLALPANLGTEFDTDNLLRMDSTTLVGFIKESVGAGVMKPNEGRKRLNLKPVPGGDSCYLQQQNFSLEALAKRDAQDNPFAASAPPPAPAAATPPAPVAGPSADPGSVDPAPDLGKQMDMAAKLFRAALAA
jgi:HK97 family phage portal protein